MSRRRAILLALAAWTLVGFYFASQAYFNPAFRMRPQWSEAVAVNLTYYYLWGLATPVVIWLARRFPPRQPRMLLLHAGASIILTFTQLVLAELVLSTFVQTTYRDQGLLYAVKTALGVNFHSSLPTYWLILAVYLAWAYSRNAAKLEAQLSRAQLDALKMQLNPHFLFNTLNSVSALMYSDVDAADKMLARLSEFLRLTVDRPVEPEIPLEQELDFIRRYLEIERIRFEERLQVSIDVEPGGERALVPSLVLQPLVENAIHHGISKRAEGGAIAIHASRDGDMLHITVRDRGEVPSAIQERIGLSNSRARVEAMRGTLTYGPTSDGFAVELNLPWSVR